MVVVREEKKDGGLGPGRTPGKLLVHSTEAMLGGSLINSNAFD